MTKFLNSVFLIAGTAIGSGLIALPISSAKIGIVWTSVIIFLAFFVAYKTSCLTIDLMIHRKKSLSIVELSYELSGRKAKIISMISLYVLSLALLCVYFSGINCVLDQFLRIDSTLICLLLFTGFFVFKPEIFNEINTTMVISLLGLITFTVFSIAKSSEIIYFNDFNLVNIVSFMPIIFTSFGVQNICPFVANQMGLKNEKAIKKAFLIGTLIPAIVYILWICSILGRVYEFDRTLYNQMLFSNVDVGVLVDSLCETSPFKTSDIILKIISFLAIATSAAGIGIGLISSLREICEKRSRILIPIIVIIIPAIFAKLVPNAFIKILAFGGMIATIFVIFMPLYLNSKISHAKGVFGKITCFIFGIIIFAELFM